MADRSRCLDQPKELLLTVLCLDELSKDARGELSRPTAERERCRERDCVTLKTVHTLSLEVRSHVPCDSRLGQALDGRLEVRNLTTAFAGGDGERRGVHAGDVLWNAAGTIVEGNLSGMTNVGTHREPFFEPVQVCDTKGVMEGRLCGEVVRTRDRNLLGARVMATYRLRFDPSREGGSGGVSGTLEGVVISDCPDRPAEPECVEFTVTGVGPNPRVEGAITFTVFVASGSPAPDTHVVTWGGTTGLNLLMAASALFPSPVAQVDATLVHFAQPATVTAFDSAGGILSTATMTAPQGVTQTLTLNGPGIAKLEIACPQADTLLTRLCHTT
ncbi:hypothetical protein [Nonomuraea sp. NPDC050643]|uniref:hypothetical protein n=1 Tax=Nonomuraea sp. NPDC050643 TaxID=3155660 RepID=UPI0033E7D977